MPPPRPPKPLLLLLLPILLVIDRTAAWRPLAPRPYHHATAATAAPSECTQEPRRDALQGQLAAAASLSLLLLGQAAANTATTPAAMAAPATGGMREGAAVWILGGFQIPAEQYGAYAERLRVSIE